MKGKKVNKVNGQKKPDDSTVSVATLSPIPMNAAPEVVAKAIKAGLKIVAVWPVLMTAGVVDLPGINRVPGIQIMVSYIGNQADSRLTEILLKLGGK